MTPYFAAALPAGTYSLRVVEDPNGTPVNIDITVTIPSENSATAAFWHASTGRSSYQSVWKLLTEAINAVSGNTYSVGSFVASDGVGVGCTLSSDDLDFRLDYANTVTTTWPKLPLEWLGWDSTTNPTSTSSALATTIQPQYTWCPRNVWNPPMDTPDIAAVGQSAVTGDGSFHAVDFTDGTVQRWTTLETVDLGVIRGRVDATALAPTMGSTLVDWATATGAAKMDDSSYPSWVALTGAGGWWHRTRSGAVPWVYVSDSASASSALEGVFRINAASSAPVSMSGWSGMRQLTFGSSLQGRQKIKLAAWRVA